MSSSSSLFAANSSPALLALQRFIRGTLRQVGLGLMSLVLILSISTPSISAPVTANSDQPSADRDTVHSASQLTSPAQLAGSALPVATTAQLAGQAKGAALHPFNLLKPRMTHSRLTSAHLFIPPSTEQVVARLAKDD